MIFLFVVAGVIVAFLVFALLYILFGVGKTFFDGVLGWHKPSKEIRTDGISIQSTCKYCGKKIYVNENGIFTVYVITST